MENEVFVSAMFPLLLLTDGGPHGLVGTVYESPAMLSESCCQSAGKPYGWRKRREHDGEPAAASVWRRCTDIRATHLLVPTKTYVSVRAARGATFSRFVFGIS